MRLSIMSTLFLILFTCFAQQDLRKEVVDTTDPSTRPLAATGQLRDFYIHYDVDPTLYQGGSRRFHNQQDLIDYVFSLTDVYNRDTFNPVGINLVISSFSFAEQDTDWDVMKNMQENEVLRKGEQHMYVHITDKTAPSIAPRFGLYYDNSYAVGATFGGPTFTNGDRSALSHEIGHLFGLDHTHALSLSYSSEVSVDPDNCGGGPHGKCTNVPELGGTIMSYCYECDWFGGKPLTSFHPFQAEKIQEYYTGSLAKDLPTISFQKLRSYIPSAASSNECAHEGSTCQCSGVVYFGPRYSSSMAAKIYAVTAASGSVKCRAGADQSFPDVLHGASKRCYCHQGATLMDVSYLPEPVEWANEGVGACQISDYKLTWDNSNSEQNVGYFTISGQPEWKCAQECLDRDACKGYNWKNQECRLYQQSPISVVNSGKFQGSTCWRRPGGPSRYPRSAHEERQMANTPNPPPVTSGQWSSWGSWSTCSVSCGGGLSTRTRSCIGGSGCAGSNSQTQTCNSLPCPVPNSDSNGAQYEDLGIGECRTYNGRYGIVLCQDPLEVCNQRCTDLCDADCECKGYMLAANSQRCQLFYDDIRDNVGNTWEGASSCMRKTQCAEEGGVVTEPEVTAEPTSRPVTREPTAQTVTAEPTHSTSSGDSYTALTPSGYCLNESGGGTRGMAHTKKTDAECRAMCDEFGTYCTGYAASNQGKSSTCYVYGRISYNDRPEGWVGAGSSWGPIDPVKGSGNVNTMTCFRKNY